MIKDILNQRNLPELLTHTDGTPVTAETWEIRRREMIDLLAEYEYGRMPDAPLEIRTEVTGVHDIAAGNAVRHTLKISFDTPDGSEFSFPAVLNIPRYTGEPIPLMVYIAFRYDEFYPLEEILDQGAAVASFIYTDVAADHEDQYKNGIAPHYIKDGVREPDQWGKIGMWAFAASRLLDAVLQNFDGIDTERIGVIGHSRLGKTAAWAGANDTRFTHIFPNNSGCSGIAVTRGKVGETFPRIAKVFPYWFCDNMQPISATIETSENTPFDQHFLVAACAPRKLFTGTALKDSWADCYAEYLCLKAASPAWELLGESGFIAPDYYPQPGDIFTEGNLAYRLRDGIHYLSRADWMHYIDFLLDSDTMCCTEDDCIPF